MSRGEPDRLNRYLFIIVTLLFWCSLYVYVPVLSPYLEQMGMSYTVMGIVLGSYGLTQIALRLPLGVASDRMKKRKPYVVAGMLAVTLSCVCFALGESLEWALAGRIMSGVAASTWVAFTVLYASMYAKEHATRAMGMISLLTAAGQLLGMSVSGFLVRAGGYELAFRIGAVIGLLGFALSFLLKEPRSEVARPSMSYGDLWPVMKDRLLWKVSTLSILAHSILFITMFGFTPSFAVYLGADEMGLTVLVLAFMIPHALTAFCSGRFLAPRFGSWPVVLAGFAVSAVCSAATSFAPGLAVLVATQALNGAVQGLHFPLLLGLAIEHIEEGKRATAMGFYQAVYAIGMFAGPFLAGGLNEWAGLKSGFYFAGVLGLLAAWLTKRWFMGRAGGMLLPHGAGSGTQSADR
ncbi:Predicted arabinose efflux permease, MFS family [Paenibacillus sp. UNCCL117]|uniref:MFS transporter n=1 Tax=unclassified Paenibacillus TaxID=185978 RepID=UPI00088F6FBD|nr:MULTISPECIES: MFS transporter [unclassified Paenibacillus]SDC53562.1 Predicted arabinose efflux permease, MFS family [Paenibacillus sp. cl123]SFW11161.1 Predicted arabinose efflux permease, MFS family [Paenibacillus sp. UNCCL117]